MKRKIFVSAVAVVLIAVLSLGATVAYFQDKAGEAKNIFTFGEVKGELSEPDWVPADALKLAPGKELPKDPKITLDSESLNAYAFIKVTVSDAAALKAVTKANTDAEVIAKLYDALGADWTLMNTPAIDTATDTIEYRYGYSAILTAGKVTSDLFTKITVPAGITTADVAEGKTLADGFTIDVKGYLIQADNMADLTTAYGAVDFN